jgi:hypothetical protein
MNGNTLTREEFESKHPLKEIQKDFDNGMSIKKIREKYNISWSTLNKAKLLNILNVYEISYCHPHTQETKNKLSILRKKYLKEHPESHPWKNKNKFVSIPCEKLKVWLITQNILFVPEYQPFLDLSRFYSVDIAFPDKMIAVEINGNQHYDRNGKLKPYYIERHTFFEAYKWKIYEIPYLFCFHENEMKDFFNKIFLTEKKVEFDYLNYQPKENNLNKEEIEKNMSTLPLTIIAKQYNVSIRILKTFCQQNNIATHEQYFWNSHRRFKLPTKGKYPDNDILQKLIWEKTAIELAKEIGVTSSGLKRYCKYRNIPTPPRGYWNKYNFGMFRECEEIKNKTINKLVPPPRIQRGTHL